MSPEFDIVSIPYSHAFSTGYTAKVDLLTGMPSKVREAATILNSLAQFLDERVGLGWKDSEVNAVAQYEFSIVNEICGGSANEIIRAAEEHLNIPALIEYYKSELNGQGDVSFDPFIEAYYDEIDSTEIDPIGIYGGSREVMEKALARLQELNDYVVASLDDRAILVLSKLNQQIVTSKVDAYTIVSHDLYSVEGFKRAVEKAR